MARQEHGNCPHCGVDLNGGSIWDHFYEQFTQGTGYWRDENGNYTTERRLLSPVEAEKAADEVASAYGATRTSGQWGREIGISDGDSVHTWHCPDCKGEWKRK